MNKLRLIFEKSGRAAYLSHLDVMRTFARAFARAGIPLRYSEGFNPHPTISIAHPLPVGFCGMRELLDCEILEDGCETVANKLNRALPDGLRVLSASARTGGAGDIRYAAYTLELIRNDGSFDQDTLRAELEKRPLMAVKKSKKGPTEVDLGEHIEQMELDSSPDGITLRLLLRVREAPINPRLIIGMLEGGLAPDFVRYRREGFFLADRVPL